jgi:hypothetical protein
LGIILGEGVEAFKSSPHGWWVSHPFHTPTNGFPLQRTPWPVCWNYYSAAALMSLSHLNPWHSWGAWIEGNHIVTGPGCIGDGSNIFQCFKYSGGSASWHVGFLWLLMVGDF